MNQMDQYREINEAISAGRRALASLEAAQRYLNSARNWGVVDILGGGLVSNLFKHSKLNAASNCLEQARADLRRFQYELRDVAGIPGLRLDIGDFLTFADFFFDGLAADVLVQSRIARARTQVAQAIDRVRRMLASLEASR